MIRIDAGHRRAWFAFAVCLAAAGLGAVGCTGDSPFKGVGPVGVPATEPAVTDFPDLNPGPPASEPEDAAAMRRQLLDQINQERAKRGLTTLSLSGTLAQVAEYHTSRMIDGNFFAHVDPYDRSTVGTRAAKFDYPYLKVGENLAAGQNSPAEVMADWLKSTGHRDNLFDADYREIGVAVLDGGRFGRYWAVELGRAVGK